MPDKEELEERITKMIDSDREDILDAKIAPCYNKGEKEERCYEERI